eukprot:CAMPEP_0184326224 /NCGR_PEP_ID=MMETSP1049-20130417/142450_1 /TAXON_ID=77928 /ORGANISM="Proteomonas sulcata, Strain CCMP704" /LENGTH=172 /DNA_ID=CAMNT_0026648407 /DNA_START=497 /DNA_END=1016 /DNA_ORIENTATION=+
MVTCSDIIAIPYNSSWAACCRANGPEPPSAGEPNKEEKRLERDCVELAATVRGVGYVPLSKIVWQRSLVPRLLELAESVAVWVIRDDAQQAVTLDLGIGVFPAPQPSAPETVVAVPVESLNSPSSTRPSDDAQQAVTLDLGIGPLPQPQKHCANTLSSVHLPCARTACALLL